MAHFRSCSPLVLGTLLAVCGLQAAGSEGTDYFERHVRPLLVEECYACHSERAPVPQAGLRVDSRAALLAGGRRGSAVVPGDPSSSLLLKALRHEGDLRMPPTGRLADDRVGRVAEWIRMGAPYPDPVEAGRTSEADRERHWALTPPRQTQPPPSASGWGKSTIDRFVEARLGAEGLEPSAQALPGVLLRRVHLDLTGLPPSPESIEAFAQDAGDAAYEQVVETLLASRQFGERWARRWLDLVRYADDGAQSRPFPVPWTYRDWVIQAFNTDLPYDRFVTLQLAADLVGADTRHLPALGLLTLGINLPRASDAPENLDDRIDVVTRGFMGLSVSCARCHDHKFDPISQEDYYALYGIFLNSPNVLEPVALEDAPAGEVTDFFRKKLSTRRAWIDTFRTQRLADHLQDFRRPETLARYLAAAWKSREHSNRQAEDLSKEESLNLYMLNRWRTYLRDLTGPSVAAFAALEEPGGAERIALGMAEADSAYRWPDPEREALRLAMRGNGSPTDVPLDDFGWIHNEGDSNVMKGLKWQYDAVMREWTHRGGPPHAMVVRDAPTLQPAYLFVRGNQYDKGQEVPRRFLSALAGSTAFREGSGRLELARSITSPSNPLTARVMVNRVWGHLFGEGLVGTPSDFGLRGDRPTHPDLLDRLAVDFVEDGWSVKDLVRSIVLSRAYRQSSLPNAAGLEHDPDNRLLWRQNRVRLDFEALRDSMLAVAGRLDTTLGGTPFELGVFPSSTRRTMYSYVSREEPSQLMRSFDFSNPEEHTPKRQLTTVPQQSLFLMNSPFLAEQARAVAAGCEETGEPSSCVRTVHRKVLGRWPSPGEAVDATAFLETASGTVAEAASSGSPSAWSHGVAHVDPDSGKVSDFRDMRYRVGDRLQPAVALPAPDFGRASLTPSGGYPGDSTTEAVVRRWWAPRAMRVSIEGKLRHAIGEQGLRFNHSNGVRAWVVSSHRGRLAHWTVRNFEVGTDMSNLDVESGEHLDFVVDSFGDYESDGFTWSPRIEEVLSAEQVRTGGQAQVWTPEEGFLGAPDSPLSPLEQYAQVLMMTNEFAYRD